MTHLPTDPADFASQAIAGFVLAHPRLVRQVDGGVVDDGLPVLGQEVGWNAGGLCLLEVTDGDTGDGEPDAKACGEHFAPLDQGLDRIDDLDAEVAGLVRETLDAVAAHRRVTAVRKSGNDTEPGEVARGFGIMEQLRESRDMGGIHADEADAEE
jgi:hypothetical protein